MNQNFDWMIKEAIYEPRPVFPQQRSRSWFKPAWVTAAIVIMVFCGLLGLR